MRSTPFKEGDIVRLRSGKSPIKVLEVKYLTEPIEAGRFKFHKTSFGSRFRPSWHVRFSYMSSLNYEHEGIRWRRADHFVLHADHFKEEETIVSTPTLYKTKEDEPQFGTFLAHDSQNKIVLELKTSGVVKAFDPSEIEEVVPYTIEIRPLDRSRQQFHAQVKKGSVEKGDLLLIGGDFYVVSGLDTRCKRPENIASTIRKVATEALDNQNLSE